MAGKPLSSYQSNSSTAIAVGANGSTNPAFQVDASASNQATGIKHVGKAAGNGAQSIVVSSAANENHNIDAKGTGSVVLNGAGGTGPIIAGQLVQELAADGLTAAGTNQGTALALTAQTNRVTTTASGTGVVLPASAAGLEITVINAGANPLQVYGAGSDTINAVAAGTGVTMPPNAVDIFVSPAAGAWHAEVGVGYSGSLYTESAKDGITAYAGGGQSNATLITTQMAKVTTVATAGDSVKLPISAAGLEICLINKTSKPMQVFGSGTDTIDDQTTTVGVSQMPNSMVIYACTLAGTWYTDGLAMGWGGPGLQTMSFADNITAHAGGGQGSAVALTAMTNRITTVATAGDSVVLPTSAAGLVINVQNAGANALQIYGAGSDTINGVASGTGVSQMVNSVNTYFCPAAGTWLANVGAGYSGSLPTQNNQEGVTAHAGGGRTSAVLLTTSLTRVTTVASANDSIMLPTAVPGLYLTVINAGANAMQVFGNGSDTIDGVAGSTGYSQPSGKTVNYMTTAAGAWHKMVSA